MAPLHFFGDATIKKPRNSKPKNEHTAVDSARPLFRVQFLRMVRGICSLQNCCFSIVAPPPAILHIFMAPLQSKNKKKIKIKKIHVLPQMLPSDFSHNDFEDSMWTSKMQFLDCSTAACYFAHFFARRSNRKTENFKMNKIHVLPQMRPSGFSHNDFEEGTWKVLASKMLFLNCSTAAARPDGEKEAAGRSIQGCQISLLQSTILEF